MNSWEAILREVKPEYLGPNSNIQGLEIYSLGTQASIITPRKWKRMPVRGWPRSCSQAVKYRANNLLGVGMYAHNPEPSQAVTGIVLNCYCI